MKPAGEHQPPSYPSIATAFEHELPSYHKRHVRFAGGESTHTPFCDGAANAGTAWAPGAKHLLWAFHVLEERRFLQHPCKPRKAQVGRRLVAAVNPDKSGIRKEYPHSVVYEVAACQMPESSPSRNKAANPLRYSRRFRFVIMPWATA